MVEGDCNSWAGGNGEQVNCGWMRPRLMLVAQKNDGGLQRWSRSECLCRLCATPSAKDEALAGLGFETPHIFRPIILLGRRRRALTGEQCIRFAQAFDWALLGAAQKYRPMPAGVLSSAMAAAGERGAPGRHVHHYREINRLAGA